MARLPPQPDGAPVARAPARRVVFVASVDLTHRGVRFGDPPVAPGDLRGIERDDRRFLAAVLRGDAAAALADARRDHGARKRQRKMCGFAPLYVLAAVLGPARGKILDYGADLSGGAVVSFAAAEIP